MLKDLFDLAQEMIGAAMDVDYSVGLRPRVEERLKARGLAHDEARVTHLLHQVVRPLMDRMYRHQGLEWAAQIAMRRGWRFNLYGNGWEKHPTLGRFARGSIEHGEELRAAYRAARGPPAHGPGGESAPARDGVRSGGRAAFVPPQAR